MTDFNRINQPRIAKIAAMIETVRRSARSNKISNDDVGRVLAPVAALVCGLTAPETPTDDAPAPEAPKPRLIWRDPPHEREIARFVADIRPDHVERYITHLVNRLCEMAATKGLNS